MSNGVAGADKRLVEVGAPLAGGARPVGGPAGDLLAENLFAAGCPERIGIERGKSFDIDKLDPAIKTALVTAPKDALALMAWKVASLARVANG